MDLKYCQKHQIPVLGTNENDRRLYTIAYFGLVALKMLMQTGLEVKGSNVIILGGGKFAEMIYKSLKLNGSITALSEPDSKPLNSLMDYADTIIVADHETEFDYISSNGLIDPKFLKKVNPDVRLIHVSGSIDEDAIRSARLILLPDYIAPLHFMSVTPDFVGPKPIIDLHTAVLKVGEELARARLSGLSYQDSITKALQNDICQDFSDEQKRKYYSTI